MKNNSIPGRQFFNHKKTVVLGLGLHGGGLGIIEYLLKCGADILVTDLRNEIELAESLIKINRLKKKFSRSKIVLKLGGHKESYFLGADVVIKSPGIPPFSPWLVFLKKNKIPVVSDIGIFFTFAKGMLVGVTGSRGKSTAAFLIWRIMDRFFKKQNSHKKVYLGGNIRISALSFLSNLSDEDISVLELSSFQLYDLIGSLVYFNKVGFQAKNSPHVAILTNIYRDHINWHGDYHSYQKAKENIFNGQKKEDALFIPAEDLTLKSIVKKAKSRIFFCRLQKKYKKVIDKNLGSHYESTISLAIAVTKYLGASESIINNEIFSFKGLEGREELLAKIRGINIVNDTTSTMPNASIAALKRFNALKNKKSSIILIAGGGDKDLQFNLLANAIKKYANTVILIPGDATKKLFYRLGHGYIPKNLNVMSAEDLDEAVKFSFAAAQKNDWIIFSPGATSFPIYKNEFDRGDIFLKALSKLRRHI